MGRKNSRADIHHACACPREAGVRLGGIQERPRRPAGGKPGG